MHRIVKVFAGLYNFNIEDLSNADYVIGVDKGALELIKNNINVDLAVGDFDSINKEELEIIKSNVISVKVLNEEKDDTDLEHVFTNYIKEDDIVYCYGTLGERMDHTFTNLMLLARFKDYSITLFNENNKIFLLNKGEHKIYKEKFKYFSLYSLDDSLVSITKCKYPLNKYELKNKNTLITSNEISDKFAEVYIHEGSILVIQSN